MADGQTIKTYSAADIEKYQQGLLSDAERHAMEKAALEDPFLADAMEGYADAGPSLQADLDDLKKRLAQRTGEKTKVIPLGGAGRSPLRWMRAAVLIGVLAGAGTLAYLFMFRTKQDEIAQAKDLNNKPSPVTTDTGNKTAIPVISLPDSTTKSGTTNATLNQAKSLNGNSTYYADSSSTYKLETKGSGALADEKAASGELVIVNNEQKELSKSTKWSAAAQERENANEAKKETSQGFFAIQADVNDKMASSQAKAKAIAPAPAKTLDENNFLKSNIFRGRVTDGQNLGVPFAKVINTDDNVGTYTDARGYFNLTSPDTVLNVQVRSIGFENNNTQLRNVTPNNQVVLQNDRRMNALVINNQRANTNRRANNAVQLQEPEPADGWENYDTYLSNNLVVPDELKNKPANSSTAAVEVSFEVDAKGQPINIRVEKSLCEKCDKEAIRLIKEGPKWKQRAGIGRTTVTVPFSQLF